MSLRFRHLIPLLAAAACVGESPPESGTPDAATAAAEAAAPAAPAKDIVAGEFIVKVAQRLTTGIAVELGGHRVVPVVEIIEGTWLVRLDVDAARAAMPLPELTRVAIADVARAAGVQYAHPNHVLEWSATPNDQYVSSQFWHYDQIRLRQAWDLVTGPVNRTDVTIAVLDTGRTDHPDLTWGAGANFAASPPNTDARNPNTYHHGVMVAGLIGANTNITSGVGTGVGVAGICWNCTIMPVRINPSNGPSTAYAAMALNWVSGLRELGTATVTNLPIRAQVVNLSYNNPDPTLQCGGDPTMQAAINNAVARGVTVVASAGNQASITGPRFPANCPATISVAASDSFDSLAAYSNRGIGTDLTAPGGAIDGGEGIGADVPANSCPRLPADPFPYAGEGGIVSTWSVWRSAIGQPASDHCYIQGGGTSFSAPHVSGVVALLRARRPGLNAITPDQIKAVLRLTSSPAQPFGPGWGFSCPDFACGAGRLDARAAVEAVTPTTTVPLAAVSPGGIEFGTVTTTATQAVTLTNRGFGAALVSNGAMQIIGSSWFRFGGACSGQSCNQSYSLPTGASINTQIVCEPTGSGTQVAELTYANNSVGQARVQLRCTGVTSPPNLVVPPSLPFGNVQVGTTGLVTLTLSNTGGSALTVNSTAFSHAVYSFGTPMPTTIPGNSSASVNLRCIPSVEGNIAGTFTINSTGGNRTVQIPCNGIVPRLVLSPTSINFGGVRVGTASDATLTLSNPGGVTLTIPSWSLNGSAFTVFPSLPTTIAPNTNVTVTVRCVPPSIGLHTGTLQMSTNAGGFSVPLSCTGINGVLAIAPNPAAFGNVRVGTSTDLNLTVRNDGNAPLTIFNAFVVTGTTFTRPGGVPSTLAPGATGLLTVRCTPPTVGLHTGTLRVTSDANTVDVALSCTGVIPGIAVAPTAIDFGVVEVGGRRPSDVTITSTGSGLLSVTSIVASGAPFSIANQSISLPPGTSAVITPRCAPTAVGTVSGWIDVHSDAGSRRVTLTCTGGQAQLAAPTWIDLPDVLLGGATTKALYLSNPGNVALTISSAALTGGNGFSFTGMPTTIAPGASAMVTLRCAPSVAGYFTGSLQIASNAATSPTSIGIACRAATGRITVVGSNNLELGWCESGTMTIQNSGVGPLEIAELNFTETGMSASGIALPATLAAGEITSWQVDCACWKPGFSVSAKHYAKHDGVQEGAFASVTCGAGTGGTIELPIDPTE